MSVVTVTGASANLIPVAFNGAAAFALARAYAATVNGLGYNDGLFAQSLAPGTSPRALPAHKIGEGVITTAGSYSFPREYNYVTDNAAGSVTLNAALMKTPTSVLAGLGGATLYGGADGTFIAGGGNNMFDGTNAASYSIATGDGNDSVYGNASSDLIQAGAGYNQIFTGTVTGTGTGTDTVLPRGTDLIVIDRGSNLVSLTGSGTTKYGGSVTLSLIDSRSDNIFYGETGSTVLFGGSSGSYYLSATTTVIGGNNDTITASGNTTVFGGSGTSIVENGSGALTFIAAAGAMPTVGGGAGLNPVFGQGGSNVSYFNAGGPNYLVAGSGNETRNGSLSSGKSGSVRRCRQRRTDRWLRC